MVGDYLPVGSELLSRFRLEKLLQKKAHTQTWIATDLRLKAPVILKTAVAATPQAEQLQREADLLKSLDFALAPRLCDCGREVNIVFLAREFKPGASLSECLSRGGPMPLQEALGLTLQLLQFLSELHDRGIVHRDLKPDNIIISSKGAFIIDFGLAGKPSSLTEPSFALVGSVRYMSPEQSGTLRYCIGPHSDLFSVGCVLYECLTGHPIFDGRTVRDVLRQQVEADVSRRLEKLDAPPAVREFLKLILARDPKCRYQSAQCALDDLKEIETRLLNGETAFKLSRQHSKMALGDPAFVGRRVELSALHEAYQNAAAGKGGIVLLEAESGGGKTRLLGEFQPAGAWIIYGQAYDQQAGRPFQIFSNLIDAIVERAHHDQDFQKHLKSKLTPHIQSLTDVFPQLRDVLELQSLQIIGPESLAEQRTLQAASELLSALGQSDRPAIIVLDDCQWADELSLKLLTYWAATNSREPNQALIIASFRSEEMPPEHLLRSIRSATRIRLEPFGKDDIQSLILSMAGDIPEQVRDVITRLSQGNVFMACSAIQGLYESGAIRPSPEGWTVDFNLLEEAQSSRRAAVFLSRRLHKFPASTLKCLRIAAVLGKEFDLVLLRELSRLSMLELMDHLREASDRRVIWPKGDSAYTFAHDKIRETLLADIEKQELFELHLQAARALEQKDRSRCYELAYHFSSAGEYVLAFNYALDAAKQARARHALRLAQEYFEIAVKGAARFSVRDQLETVNGLGDVYMLLGKYDLARQQFEKARVLSDDPIFRSELDGKTGELFFKQGDVEAAAKAVEQGLRGLNRWVPSSWIAVLIGCLWETVIQTIHTLRPIRSVRTPKKQELLALYLYSRLAYIYWFGKGLFACFWAHIREMNLAEHFGETLQLAQAYSEHAPAMTQIPWFSRGVRYVQRSLRIRRRLGDLWGQAQSLHFYGVVLYSSSHYQQSIASCREALSLFERTGDRWEANTASWHISLAQYRLGNLKEALECAMCTFEAGQLIGDHQASGISLSVWSKATGGLVPENLIRTEMQRIAGDAHTRVELLTGESIRLMRGEQWDLAIGRLQEAIALIHKKSLRQEYVVPSRVWLVTALRRKFESLPLHAVHEKEDSLKQALKHSRAALRLARLFTNNLPHALRERALLLAYAGKPRRALALLKRSIETAEKFGARQERGESLIAYGRLTNDATSVSEGERLLQECEAPLLRLLDEKNGRKSEQASPSLADRFDALLTVGREITLGLDVKSIFESAKKGARELLRVADCSIVELPLKRPPSNICRQLLDACLERREPVCLEEFLTQSPDDSIVLLEPASMLYAPIMIGGQPIAVLTAVHPRLQSLFGEEERRLAGFITVLAGAALENASRVSKIQQLSEERNQLFQQAQKAIEARDQFLSLASHELKTPLTSLLLHSRLLARQNGGEAPERIRKFLPLFDRQLQKLDRLVEDLLDVSRLSTGRFQLNAEKEMTNLATLIRDVIAEMQIELDEAGCSVSFTAVDEPSVPVDRTRIAQVVSNLLNNAKKYAAGQIEVTLHSEGKNAVIDVADHGPGIPKRFQSLIFERFGQVPSNGSPGGLGLGLFISRQIVRSHGGDLSIQSEPDCGAKFSLRLPFIDDRSDEPSPSLP